MSARGAYGSAWAARSRRATSSGSSLTVGVEGPSGFDSETGHSPRDFHSGPTFEPGAGHSLGSPLHNGPNANFPAFGKPPFPGQPPAAEIPPAATRPIPIGLGGSHPIQQQGSGMYHSRSDSGQEDSETSSSHKAGNGGVVASGGSGSGSGGQALRHQRSQSNMTTPSTPLVQRNMAAGGAGGHFPAPAAVASGNNNGQQQLYTSQQGSPSSTTQPVQWKKALYERQPFDDNYVDHARFLAEMKKNAFVKEYPYLEIVRDMFAIVQQLSITVIFVMVYQAVHEQMISRVQMLTMNAILVLCGVVFYVAKQQSDAAKAKERDRAARLALVGETFLQPGLASALREGSTPGRDATSVSGGEVASRRSDGRTPPRSGTNQQAPTTQSSVAANGGAAAASKPRFLSMSSSSFDDGTVTVFGCIRQGIVLTLTLLLLAPIFRTLTQTYTSDTIRALCIGLLFIHNVFADYNYINGYSSKFEQNVAGNAALFATVLLASRIQSPSYASTLIGFGVLMFTLSPIIRHHLKKVAVEAHVALTFTLYGVAIGCLIGNTPLLAGVFVAAIVSIVLIIPWAFVVMQRQYKFQISGPWDEAKPVNSTAAAEWANAR
jgi:hypothetical protein